jgi:hypothetical protein
MNPKVPDFPALIRWIADKYHGGAVHPIHARIDVSPSLVQLWVHGGVKNPNLEHLERLCAVYHLDFPFVRGLLLRTRRPVHPIAGGSSEGGTAPLANLAEILPLIGSWLCQWVWPLHRSWACA